MLKLSEFISEAKKPNFDLGERVQFEEGETKLIMGKKKYEIKPDVEYEVIDKTGQDFSFQLPDSLDFFVLTAGEVKAFGGRLV